MGPRTRLFSFLAEESLRVCC